MCIRFIFFQDNRVASRKFYQHAHSCVGIEQMAQLILIIWKFLRNHIHKQLQKNRQNSQREETRRRQPRGRASKRTRGEASASSSSGSSPDEDKENQGEFEQLHLYFDIKLTIYLHHRRIY